MLCLVFEVSVTGGSKRNCVAMVTDARHTPEDFSDEIVTRSSFSGKSTAPPYIHLPFNANWTIGVVAK